MEMEIIERLFNELNDLKERLRRIENNQSIIVNNQSLIMNDNADKANKIIIALKAKG